jgi:hypothetical protein
MPVAIQLTLQFQEVTYLTKADFRFDGLGEATAESKISNRDPNNIV